jgi:hypothetical protein
VPGLAQGAVEALPRPVDAGQRLAPLDRQCPEAADHAALDPPLERAVDAGVVAELPRGPVPLPHAAPRAVDHAVQGVAPVDATGAEAGGRVVLGRHLPGPRPQRVVHPPDRRQRLRRSPLSRHPWLPS